MLKRFFLCGTNGDKVRNGSFPRMDGSFNPDDIQYQEDVLNEDEQDSSSKPTRTPKRIAAASKNDIYSFNYALTLKNKEIADLKMKVINYEEILNEKERLERKVQELQFTLEQKDDLIRKLKTNSITSNKWPILYWMWSSIPKYLILFIKSHV